MTSEKPTGLPDTARSAVRRGVLVARVSARTGGIEVVAPVESDELLTGPEIAQRLGLSPATWRSFVYKGFAPKADDPDEGRPVNRRSPRWRESTVAAWKASRPGRGRRTDLMRGGGA